MQRASERAYGAETPIGMSALELVVCEFSISHAMTKARQQLQHKQHGASVRRPSACPRGPSANVTEFCTVTSSGNVGGIGNSHFVTSGCQLGRAAESWALLRRCP